MAFQLSRPSGIPSKKIEDIAIHFAVDIFQTFEEKSLWVDTATSLFSIEVLTTKLRNGHISCYKVGFAYPIAGVFFISSGDSPRNQILKSGRLFVRRLGNLLRAGGLRLDAENCIMMTFAISYDRKIIGVSSMYIQTSRRLNVLVDSVKG